MLQNSESIAVRPKVGLVIGAGGILCAATIGVQRVLAEHNIPIDMVVGCSGGSIFAGMIALGFSPAKVNSVISRLWTREITSVKRQNWWQTMMPRHSDMLAEFGMRDDALIVERLQAAFGTHTFEDTHMPLAINATDIRNGQMVVFQKGTLITAIRASIAIPSVFTPLSLGDRLLVDGALSNPLPIDLATQAGADIIIAIGFASPYTQRVRTLMHYTRHINTVLANNLLRNAIAAQKQAHNGTVITLMPDLGEKVGIFDVQKMPHIIEAGATAMKAHLPALQAALVI